MDFTKQKLPPTYHKAGRECYLDPIRKRLTYITPEETVRQQVINYLIEELEVPTEMIDSEVPLSYYGIDVKGRADILIHKMKDGIMMPICVVECKAPNVFLSQKVEDQAIRYADNLVCDYVLMTNGLDCKIYYFDEVQNLYIAIQKLPKFKEMIKGEYNLAILEENHGRVEFNKLEEHMVNIRNTVDCSDIGNGTPIDKAVLCLNLMECLLDETKRFEPKRFKIFNLIEDIGLRDLSYGNAGAGVFWGTYRSFIIEYNGENQIISLGSSSYSREETTGMPKTALIVAIDTDKAQHHALQLVIDDNVECINDEYTFYHSGRIAVGNIGSGKVSELKELIAEYYPTILKNDRICLGKLKNDKLFQLTDESVIELIENLVSYSLVRDIYRGQVKARKQNKTLLIKE